MSTESIAALFGQFRKERVTNMMGIPGYRLKADCYVGLRGGLPCLLVVTTCEAPEMHSSSAISVSQHDAGAGKCELLLTVTDKKFEELFYKVCSDLLDVMQGAPNESSALSRMAARWDAWREFWKNKSGAMTEEKVRGLIGEMIFLKSLLKSGMSAEDVVRGWLGPGRKDQDFVFDGGWAEVKTVGQSAAEVKISSLDQLVNPKEFPEDASVLGRLVIVRLQNEPAGNRAFTLCDIYNEIRELLKDEPHALNQFVNSTEMAGADVKGGELERRMRVQLLEKMLYDVNAPDFPRLIRNETLPAAVTKANYCLSIPALEPWRIKEEESGDDA